jgi:hypothetical protein
MANTTQSVYHAVRSEHLFRVDNSMIELVVRTCKLLFDCLKQWTRPVTTGLASGILSDTMRSRADLIAENALLRQQLIVLKRQAKRPQLTPGDRVRLVLLARFTQFWQQALHIVQPDTLLRWHRELKSRDWVLATARLHRMVDGVPKVVSRAKSD